MNLKMIEMNCLMYYVPLTRNSNKPSSFRKAGKLFSSGGSILVFISVDIEIVYDGCGLKLNFFNTLVVWTQELRG